MFAALALLGTLGIAAVATTSPEPRAPADQAPTGHRKGLGAPVSSGRPSARALLLARTARREAAAIDRVLRYTPGLTGGGRRRREIALTFDDGPSPYTRPILRILTRMHAPATFFIVGQQLNHFPNVLREEVAGGFEIGDHTENHSWLSRLTPSLQHGQLRDAALRIRHLGAPFPRLFRPPYGAYNGATIKVARILRMLMVLWSVDPQDWRRPGTGPIAANVLANARPGAIVLMHDGGGDRLQTIAALPAIINGLRRRHYTLVSVGQLMSDDAPGHQRLPHLSGI